MATRKLSATDTATAVQAPVPLTPIKDASIFNAGFGWENTSGVPAVVADYYGETLREKPVLQHGENVFGTVRWQLDSGLAHDVSDNTITWGFASQKHATGIINNPAFGDGKGYSPFTAAQQDAARIAMQNWDELVKVDFVEVKPGPGASDFGRQTMDITLANTTTGPAQAAAFYPGYGQQYERIAGDVWVADPRLNTSNDQLKPGQYGLQTLNHEIGHSLGLSHPGVYNFGADTDGIPGPDPITYTKDAQYFQDSNQFSIMSYFDSYETGAQNIDWNVMRFVYPSTPMVDDVRVIQQKYGADTMTRTGDSTYGFNSTGDVTNAAMKFYTGEMATIFTIWDAGGKDTLDLSGYFTNSVIDLREGAYSSAGGWGAYDPALLSIDPGAIGSAAALAYINANNAAAGFGPRNGSPSQGVDYLYNLYFKGVAGVNEGIAWKTITGTSDEYLMEQNIGIAYGAVIEDGIGGHGDDRINGNDANNVLTGNAGDDLLIGLGGMDTLSGGTGDDTFAFLSAEIGDIITDFSDGDTIDLSALYAGAMTFIDDAGFTALGQVRYEGGVLSANLTGDDGVDFSVTLANAAVVHQDALILT